MATYYARNVTGNWASSSSWDASGSGGAGPAGPPIAGDTAIFDSGFTGNITVAATAACAVLTVQSGATGTLTWGAFTLTVSGNVTLVTGFNLAGSTGRLSLPTTSTITSAGITFPCNITMGGGVTYTLVGNLATSAQLFISGNAALAGAYDVSCADCVLGLSLQIVSGQRLTVTNSLIAQPATSSGGTNPGTIRAVTASSVAYIEYTGTAANLKCFTLNFTDIDFSTYSTPVTGLDNWYGGTLTRTVGITNRTSADIGGGGGGPLVGVSALISA